MTDQAIRVTRAAYTAENVTVYQAYVAQIADAARHRMSPPVTASPGGDTPRVPGALPGPARPPARRPGGPGARRTSWNAGVCNAGCVRQVRNTPPFWMSFSLIHNEGVFHPSGLMNARAPSPRAGCPSAGNGTPGPQGLPGTGRSRRGTPGRWCR